MSYSFQVEVKDGQPTVGVLAATVPDGKYTVNGHEEDAWLSIGVTRWNAENVQIAQANSYAKRS